MKIRDNDRFHDVDRMSSERPTCDDDDTAPRHPKRLKNTAPEDVPQAKPQPKFRNEDYTVGWICAITTEYVAAQAFLDEKHNRPEHVSPNDNNDYTLGEIGKHKVVLAVLPDGEYGISSAASVARDMLHAFPNIRVGLMVGVGGGAPSSRHDIRLGDVVVSAPREGKGGVFQYDFGRAIQGQEFQVTGYLNQPPMFLRTAVNGLKAEYESEGHRFGEVISNILEKKPRLRRYRQPDSNTDKLYQSNIIHPAHDDSNCATVCSSSLSDLVLRQERPEFEDNPAIHYGLIASANQLMNDALLRDKFAKENQVLCFETEAAGLMNHFPCLVVRGICDYSDTHKNQDWQGYAAMMASAYAKDLLNRIPANKVEAERRIKDMLSSVEHDVHETRCDVQNLALEQRRTMISRWLSPPDPSTNYNNALKQRQEGTGLWLLQNSSFQNCKMQKNSFLWLHGIPGCGKTVLSSTVIENLEKSFPTQPLLFYYFDFNDTEKQTLENMVRSLISQLHYKCVDAQKQLEPLFSSCGNGNSQPNCESLCKALLQMIEHAKEVWIVLDALDECRTRTGRSTEGLLEWISELLSSEHRNVHLIVTSRPEQDIKEELSKMAKIGDEVVPIQSNLIKDDIYEYIRVSVREGKGLKRWRSHPDIQDMIQTCLMQKANGMFRWVSCQVDTLQKCPDPRSLQNALRSLPKDLNETYSRILSAIPLEYKSTATRLLQFLTFSERPLTVAEAVDAIAVDIEGNQYFNPKYRMPDSQEILHYCSSLVIMVPGVELPQKGSSKQAELQLAHFSVKEYLTSDQVEDSMAKELQEKTARASISTVCLAYMLHFDQHLAREDVRQDFPLAQYSAMYWMDHASAAECEGNQLQDWIERFFDYQKPAYQILYCLYRPDEPWERMPEWHYDEPAQPLYYASFGNLEGFVKMLLRKGANVNAQGGDYGNALQAASARGHKQIVEVLLKKGANVNAQGGGYNNALQAASARGHKQIVEVLLKKSANVNAQGGYYSNALQAASVGGYKQIVEVLLKKGANVNAQGGDYNNALQAASVEGHKQIVEVLLKKGANVNVQGGQYRNALQAASARGHKQIVEMLLKKGANVNAQGGYYSNALQAALERGNKQIVEVLLKKGANVNAQGGFYGNALQAASAGGYKQIVEVLLKKGANVNAQGGRYGNALQAASERGHRQIVKLLLEEGADVLEVDQM